jgi:hypothetical protein
LVSTTPLPEIIPQNIIRKPYHKIAKNPFISVSRIVVLLVLFGIVAWLSIQPGNDMVVSLLVDIQNYTSVQVHQVSMR